MFGNVEHRSLLSTISWYHKENGFVKKIGVEFDFFTARHALRPFGQAGLRPDAKDAKKR